MIVSQSAYHPYGIQRIRSKSSDYVPSSRSESVAGSSNVSSGLFTPEDSILSDQVGVSTAFQDMDFGVKKEFVAVGDDHTMFQVKQELIRYANLQIVRDKVHKVSDYKKDITVAFNQLNILVPEKNYDNFYGLDKLPADLLQGLEWLQLDPSQQQPTDQQYCHRNRVLKRTVDYITYIRFKSQYKQLFTITSGVEQ